MITASMFGTNTHSHPCNLIPSIWQPSRPSLGRLITMVCLFQEVEQPIVAFVSGTHWLDSPCSASTLGHKFATWRGQSIHQNWSQLTAIHKIKFSSGNILHWLKLRSSPDIHIAFSTWHWAPTARQLSLAPVMKLSASGTSSAKLEVKKRTRAFLTCSQTSDKHLYFSKNSHKLFHPNFLCSFAIELFLLVHKNLLKSFQTLKKVLDDIMIDHFVHTHFGS